MKTAKDEGNIGFDSDHLIQDSHKLVLSSICCDVFIAKCYYYKWFIILHAYFNAQESEKSVLFDQDIVIMSQFSEYIYTSDLQFGFKPIHTTILCMAIYMEIVQYYFICKNTDIFSCLLDDVKQRGVQSPDSFYCVYRWIDNNVKKLWPWMTYK